MTPGGGAARPGERKVLRRAAGVGSHAYAAVVVAVLAGAYRERSGREIGQHVVAGLVGDGAPPEVDAVFDVDARAGERAPRAFDHVADESWRRRRARPRHIVCGERTDQIRGSRRFADFDERGRQALDGERKRTRELRHPDDERRRLAGRKRLRVRRRRGAHLAASVEDLHLNRRARHCRVERDRERGGEQRLIRLRRIDKDVVSLRGCGADQRQCPAAGGRCRRRRCRRLRRRAGTAASRQQEKQSE